MGWVGPPHTAQYPVALHVICPLSHANSHANAYVLRGAVCLAAGYVAIASDAARRTQAAFNALQPSENSRGCGHKSGRSRRTENAQDHGFGAAHRRGPHGRKAARWRTRRGPYRPRSSPRAPYPPPYRLARPVRRFRPCRGGCYGGGPASQGGGLRHVRGPSTAPPVPPSKTAAESCV